ncbi:MAG TPA: hypothetical protein DEO93_07210 [Stenotrophomonas sp.]|nr:hypothetical protein [Stenotrophomonas sp.]
MPVMFSEVVMRILLMLGLLATPYLAFAEGRCPPGQYPVGGQGAGGCAPIPGSGGGSSESGSPVPTGKWEDRWGAIAEESSPRAPGVPLATGVSESRKTKREANAVALEECKKVGGKKCTVTMTYFNQCVALADPTIDQLKARGGKSIGYRAKTDEDAKALALKECEGLDGGQQCRIIYSACSLSEFKSFR